MGIEFLYRVTKTSILSGLIVSLMVATRLGWDAGVGFLAGCGWSLVNVHLIRRLVTLICDDDRRRWMIAGVTVAKVPLMYGIGFLMLYVMKLPLWAALMGFLWPLIVIALKSVARIFLRMDGPSDGLGVQKN